MHPSLDETLKSLGLPPTSRKIYIELLTSGESTARILSERLMLTRPSTYDHLAILKKQGLIVEKEIDNKAYFAIDDVRTIGTMLDTSIESLTEKRDVFASILPKLLQEAHTTIPTIKFYEGTLGLTHLVNDILIHNSKQVYTLWPYREMLRVIGKEPLVRFNKRRLQEKITIHALWPHNEKADAEYIWSDGDAYTKRKNAPKGATWDMGYSIYGDRVSFISSHTEVFGFIVASKDFAQLMKVQFDALWKLSS